MDCGAHERLARAFPFGLVLSISDIFPILSWITPGDLADFKSPLDNSPMIFELQSGEVETPVVKKFKETGSTTIAVMTTRSPMARNSTHQTASSVTVLMVPARWVPR